MAKTENAFTLTLPMYSTVELDCILARSNDMYMRLLYPKPFNEIGSFSSFPLLTRRLRMASRSLSEISPSRLRSLFKKSAPVLFAYSMMLSFPSFILLIKFCITVVESVKKSWCLEFMISSLFVSLFKS